MSPTSKSGRNRSIVLEFYRAGLVGRKPFEAFARFVAPDFVEHKPDVAVPSREGAAAYLAELMRELPAARWEVVRTIAEEDYVFLHARFVPAPGAEAYAVADIFRLHDGLIAEHWDVVSGPPAASKNPQPRF